jgi:hypothetical protein
VQEDDSALGAVALGGGLEHVDEAHQRDVEAVDGVAAPVGLVAEEAVAGDLLLVVDVLLGRLPPGDLEVVEAAAMIMSYRR